MGTVPTDPGYRRYGTRRARLDHSPAAREAAKGSVMPKGVEHSTTQQLIDQGYLRKDQ